MLSSACLLTLLCLQLAPPIQGSSSLYSGNQFVTAFMEVYPWGRTQFELILTGIDCCAVGNVTIQGTNFFQSFTVQQGEMVRLALPNVVLNGSSISSAGVIVILSNSSISVISKVWGEGGYDSSYIYPVDILEKQYYVITPFSALPMNAQFAILSLDQANSVTVILYGGTVTFQGKTLASGSSTTFQLLPYQGAQFQLLDGDLSGSFIQASKPIAVLSGHQGYQKYPMYTSGYTFEQLIPVTIWGKVFVLPPLSVQPRKADEILVVASQGTNLNVYNGSVLVASTSLSKGDIFVQKINTNALWINADHGVMVMFVCSGNPSDATTILTPFMTNVMSTSDLDTSQIVHASTEFTTNLLVVTTSGQLPNVLVDGIPLPPNTTWNDNDFKALKYAWVEVTVSRGSHYVQQLLDKEYIWVMFYSFTGNATSLQRAGNTSVSFNFYGSGLGCTCQGLQLANASLYGMTTPNASLYGMTTPNTSLYGMTTPNTSLYGMTTLNTSLTTRICRDGLSDLYTMSMKVSWWDALRYCRQRYTDLFSVPDSGTQNLLTTAMKKASIPGTGVWIGLRRHKVWGYLYWTDGQPTDYMNWGDGEPSNPITNMCTLISPDKNYTWKDQCCAMKLGFLCY